MNQNDQSISIPLSRVKLSLLTIGALGLMLASIYIIVRIYPGSSPASFFGIAISAIAAIFFGGCTFFGFTRLFDSHPAVIIYPDGFLNYNSFFKTRFIQWKEIEHIGSLKIQQQRFISIKLKDPQKFINKTSGIQKLLLRLNTKFYGTPIHISAASLQYDLDSLREIIVSGWKGEIKAF